MTGNQERQFRFGAIVHQDYQDLALLLPELEDRLNQHINLRDYTDQITRIYFAPIIMPASSNDQEEERWFDDVKQELMVKVKLPIEQSEIPGKSDFAVLVGDLLSDDLTSCGVLPADVGQLVREVVTRNGD